MVFSVDLIKTNMFLSVQGLRNKIRELLLKSNAAGLDYCLQEVILPKLGEDFTILMALKKGNWRSRQLILT